MELDYISSGRIVDYCTEQIRSGTNVLPISPARALSQKNNPHAEPADTLLIVARNNSDLLGYIGILPAKSSHFPGERIYWNSCWWASASSGAGVSMLLLKEFLKITGDRVAFSDMTSRTVRIINSLGFKTQSRKGYLIRLRSGLHKRSLNFALKAKYPDAVIALRSTGILKLMDWGLSSGGRSRLSPDEKIPSSLVFQNGSEIPGNDFFDFIAGFSVNEIFVPGKETVKWWLDYPWLVKPTAENLKIARKYHFSYVASDHYLLFPVVKENKDIIACGILSVRDGVLKTHYLWFKDQSGEYLFRQILRYALSNKKIHSIQSFHPEFCNFFETYKKLALRISQIERYTGRSNILPEKLKFQDGNGDYVFT